MHLYDDSEINMINAATHLELIDLETNKKIRTNNEKWREFLIKLQEEKENEIIIPLKEKGIKVSPIRINDSLLMNIRTTF
jgi:hypothetical protein